MEWTWCQARKGKDVQEHTEQSILKNQISQFGSNVGAGSSGQPRAMEGAGGWTMTSMWPHSCWWCHEADQDGNLFLCHLLELLSCPFPAFTLRCLCHPCSSVLANCHDAGAAPQGEMNIPIINGGMQVPCASRNKDKNTEVPAPSSQVSLHSQSLPLRSEGD